MKGRDWELHISILGWLYILGNAIYLVIGGLGLIFMTGIGLASKDPQAIPILSFIGGIGLVFFTLLALPGLIAGFGLLKRKSWARILALVLAILGLLNFPVGTLVSIYALWVLLQTDVSDYFLPLKAA